MIKTQFCIVVVFVVVVGGGGGVVVDEIFKDGESRPSARFFPRRASEAPELVSFLFVSHNCVSQLKGSCLYHHFGSIFQRKPSPILQATIFCCF